MESIGPHQFSLSPHPNQHPRVLLHIDDTKGTSHPMEITIYNHGMHAQLLPIEWVFSDGSPIVEIPKCSIIPDGVKGIPSGTSRTYDIKVELPFYTAAYLMRLKDTPHPVLHLRFEVKLFNHHGCLIQQIPTTFIVEFELRHNLLGKIYPASTPSTPQISP